jgi:hypothetical protein
MLDMSSVEAARRGLRRMERKARSSPTAEFCPGCRRATIRRQGGEWCRWCRDFIREVPLSYQVETRVSTNVRVLGNRPF